MSKRMQNFHGSKKRKKPGTSSKKRRHCRPQPSYYIHQTDNDMLLLISNDLGSEDLPQGLNKRARRCLDAPVSEIQHIASPESTTDHGWGSAMPLEILQKIFQLLADSEGSVPTLCRLSCVCRRWYEAASTPALWHRVSLGFCWVEPGKKQPPSTQKKIIETVESLIKERLSLLSDFSLHHWKEHVPFVVKSLSASCPLLSSLTLSHCSGVTSDALLSAASNCAQLQSLNLQNSQVESLAVLGTFEVCGSRLQRLFLTYSNKSSAILSSLSNGSCSNLKILELNTEIKQGESHLQICIEALQSGCPKLEVLRLLNLVWSPKSGSRCSPEAPGFVELHELCLATSSYSFVSDTVCQKLLRDSSKLQVLDLRGCYRVTPEGICKLPCTDLQRLYLGLYCSTKNLALPRSGCALLVRRWQHSLQELDLTAQSYSEEDLAQALDVLCRGGVNESLSSLNLAGTKVTAPAVRELLSSCPSLTHLDLSSCRYLPRGMKRVYRSTEEICKCLQGLLEGLEVAPEEEACM
ncbi:F-box/LRR-repeat protein 6 isoform X1 [Bombina bombina]|uniref:F-box/LRR-repeat protein 6 isoform X1 n=1 Tax=Bombina bombina TaxID=8345 RepID=UPI00235AF3ED|nr:F-box/LRR-repeat protein 6 isoform X1 [Bombina bombina]